MPCKSECELSDEEFDQMIAEEFGDKCWDEVIKEELKKESEEETVDDKLARLQELINESLKLESDVKEKTKELKQEVADIKEEKFKKICEQLIELRETAKGLGDLMVDTGMLTKHGNANYWVRLHTGNSYTEEVGIYSGKNEYYLNTIYINNSLQNNQNRVSTCSTRIDLDYIMDNWNPEVFEQNFIAAVHEVLSKRAAEADKEYQNAKAKLEEESK